MEEQNQGQVPNIDTMPQNTHHESIPETLGSKKPNLKLIIPIVVVVLLLAGGAAAFFTDLRYKLPFFGNCARNGPGAGPAAAPGIFAAHAGKRIRSDRLSQPAGVQDQGHFSEFGLKL